MFKYSLKGSLKHQGFFFKTFILLGFTFFFFLLSVFLWKVFTAADIHNISSLKTLQFLQSVGTFILPPLLVAYLWSKKPLAYLHLTRKSTFAIYVYILIFMILIIPFINLLGYVNQQIELPETLKTIEDWMRSSELQAKEFTDNLLKVTGLSALLLNIILIAVLPAIGEELYFRGVLQRIIGEPKNMMVGIWLAAFIFSAIHMQFYGFIPRFLMGAFFGYLVYWSGNLWLPIMAHFVNNGLAVVFFYFKHNGHHVPDIETIGTESTRWIGVTSGFIGVVGIVFLYKKIKLSTENKNLLA